MPVNIYFIRHGKAEPSDEYIPDAKRKLTNEGKLVVKNSAGLWKEFVDSIDIIISSSLIRALQTAEIIREVFGVKAEVLKDNSLLNGGKTEDLLLLAESLEKENIAMVGHQPDLSEHISKLISSQEINLKIPAASIVNISFEGKPVLGKGVLEFLIPPQKIKG